MIMHKKISYVTDMKGRKKSVLLEVGDFERMQEEMEDLHDALELEKARRDATGFKKWKDFIKELDVKEKK